MSNTDSATRPSKGTGAKKKARRARPKAKKQPSTKQDASPLVRTPDAPVWKSWPVAIALVLGLAAGGTGGFFTGQQFPEKRARRPDPGPAYIELAAWSPRKGPNHAKVTVVEFSDFQ